MLSALETVERALKDVADVQPVFMAADEKKAALLGLTRLVGQVEELRGRVLVGSDDLAEAEGMRDPAAWLAHHARLDRGEAHRVQRLGRALDEKYAETGRAVREGTVSTGQAEVMVRALDHLPAGLDPAVRAAAEARLVGAAAEFEPRRLRILGRKVLEVIAPEVVEAAEDADILVIETGLNDLDETGALEKVAAGACGGPDGNRCLRAMGERWNRHFESIARTVDRLRAGKPTALRLVTSQNVFVSDPSIVTDYGLPDDFALTGGRLLTRMLTTAICRTAHHHGGQCIDVALLFNGPHDDQPRDENTPESMNLVAQALFDTGLPELE